MKKKHYDPIQGDDTSVARAACTIPSACGQDEDGSTSGETRSDIASVFTCRSARISSIGRVSISAVPFSVTTLPDDVNTGGSSPKLATAVDSSLARLRAFAIMRDL